MRNERVHQVAVAHIAMPELISARTEGAFRTILHVARIREDIENDDSVVRILVVQIANKIGANETCSACH